MLLVLKQQRLGKDVFEDLIIAKLFFVSPDRKQLQKRKMTFQRVCV